MKSLSFSLGLALSMTSALGARAAEEAPAPPAGWEAPSPLKSADAKKEKKPKVEAAACCQYDAVCCARQSSINDFLPLEVIRAFEVKFADLPEAVVKEAPKDGPLVEGAPPVRVIDDSGRPFPWPGGPQGYGIHVLPPGRYGYIQLLNSDWGGHGFFEPIEYRGMGSGEMRDIKDEDKTDKGKRLLTVGVEYVGISKNDAGKIVIDDVKGNLDGSPEVKSSLWIHAETIDALPGVIHAYRGPFIEVKDKERKLTESRVSFVLPETFDKFTSLDARQEGGHFPSRFTSTFPYTRFWLPFGPGKSNLVTAELDDFQLNRWFPRPKGAEKYGESPRIAIAVSQTSVEAEPRVRVFVLNPRKPSKPASGK